MPKIKFSRHLNIRSEVLRAMLHEAWKHGNDSYNIHNEPLGEQERREYIADTMLTRGFAMVIPVHWVNCEGCGKLGEPNYEEHHYCGGSARCQP